MKKVAINGMGRIGRATLKIISDTPEIEVVAINDIAPIDNIAYLLKHDSVHGTFEKDVDVTENSLVVDGKTIPFYQERNPSDLPWKQLGVDIVIESTGVFTKQEDAQKHVDAGAKTVIISGPTSSADVPTVVHGVNTKDGQSTIFSCASCTTNNISPVMEILGRRIGIEKAIMTTIHANTASNKMVDAPSKKMRMGRSGINNLIPTTTGAATATTKALPLFKDKFDGMAIRVPVAVGSVSDITLVTSKKTTVEDINAILEEEAQTSQYKGVLKATYSPIVSSDIIKDPHASIVDLEMTKVVDGDLVKILAWYDNEWGFANQMVRQIQSL
ncbi:type I glyceraldehyde-3-phosphate dehydrogenase [Seonamhaeicola marinus]|uniref:Glyceraldehyde-3-phosphate dehydrogenase n=1 Tax=Seonamhaeicola marinus TaxID=1912246 RepID=A0A5D0HW46_9FLAO|nr:type I glyceraldehyde-3-phosphate dehydrogenase [Seonamhaeicola marinus]TYA74749.1 type I glyceraldehyde-3-phosphate dehydrogenase [Seonamhaeicola marinus]